MSRSVPGEATAYFIVAPGRRVEWGVDAASVTKIVAEADWQGASPLDAAALCGIEIEEGLEPRRVLVVATGRGEVAVRAAGRIGVRNVARSQVCSLPRRELGDIPSAVRDIVLGDDERSLLVLDVGKLEAGLGDLSPKGTESGVRG